VQVRAFIICAEWCGVCRELKMSLPPTLKETLTWIDLDNDEDLLEGLDVDSFPTLAVYRFDTWVFWGNVKPVWSIIERACATVSGSVNADVSTKLGKLLRSAL